MGAWDKRKIIFRVEGIGNGKVEPYKDSHFTWTYIKFCTLMVTAGFWVRYLELFPSVFLFALDWSWKNLVRNITGPFIRKNKLLVTQAAVYIRKIICTSATLQKARIAVVVGSRLIRFLCLVFVLLFIATREFCKLWLAFSSPEPTILLAGGRDQNFFV